MAKKILQISVYNLNLLFEDSEAVDNFKMKLCTEFKCSINQVNFAVVDMVKECDKLK